MELLQLVIHHWYDMKQNVSMTVFVTDASMQNGYLKNMEEWNKVLVKDNKSDGCYFG